MEITEVNELIEELERCDTTYQNCNDLAGLYSVRDNLNAQKVEKEIDDILPAYRSYVEKKNQISAGRRGERYCNKRSEPCMPRDL